MGERDAVEVEVVEVDEGVVCPVLCVDEDDGRRIRVGKCRVHGTFCLCDLCGASGQFDNGICVVSGPFLAWPVAISALVCFSSPRMFSLPPYTESTKTICLSVSDSNSYG